MGVPGTKRKPKKDGEIADAGDDTDNKIDAIRDALAGGDMKAFLDAASDPSLNLGDVADRLEASDMDEADVEDATEQAEIAAMLAGNFDLYTDIKQRPSPPAFQRARSRSSTMPERRPEGKAVQ